MGRRALKITLAIPLIAFTLLLFLPSLLSAQTSPEAFLGFKVGADRKLADYNQIQAYFQKLEKDAEGVPRAQGGWLHLPTIVGNLDTA